MKVRLAYGKTGLAVDLPDDVTVIRSQQLPGLADEAEALRKALRQPIGSPPLSQRVKPGDSVAIVHSDITRATPNDRILPVIIAELENAGVRSEDIVLINALGTHRPQTEAELRQMLGDAIVDNYRCLQHDGQNDDELVSLGKTKLGHPVRINRTYLEADVKILTGFIEPHLFAGFSGGPKAVIPALAGAESVLSNHGYHMVGHPNATWGVTEGNPIWEEMLEVALRTEPSFLLNVALNAEQEITGIFAGELRAAHRAGTDFVRRQSMVAVKEPFDVAITTNSGYPLDQNLYQCTKGMRAAQQVVRKGGGIILAGACRDGVPDHGLYAQLLAKGRSPQGVLDMISAPGFGAQDQWQVQIQALVQLHARIFVYSDGLNDEQIRAALFEPCRNILQTVEELRREFGSDARVCVIPEGPQTVAYVEAN
ncbi:MAG: nickel-dependent lactate racemase [Chloroflexota bacterium]|nr:nickel-dependent lactate racemase [Chloroflexota bacterium]